MRQTIADIARAAGVSTATVDRVLNERAGVHARTRRRVLTAAQGLGYLDAAPEGAGAAPAELAFIIPGGTNTFFGVFSDALAEIAQRRSAEARIRVHRMEAFHPEALAAGLRDLARQADGIALIALTIRRCAPPSARRRRRACAWPPWFPTSPTCRATPMSASTTAPPAGSPDICSAASCAAPARSRCSPARSAIAATRSAPAASAASSPRSSPT